VAPIAPSAYRSVVIIWSYKLERFDLMAAKGGYSGVEADLNAMGEQGWELIGVQEIGPYPYAMYKRPVDVGE
jgi:hypothetical protein